MPTGRTSQTKGGKENDMIAGIEQMWEEVKADRVAVDSSFKIYNWWVNRFMETNSQCDIWTLVPASLTSPSLIKLSTPGATTFHPDLLRLFDIEITGKGIMGIPGVQIALAIACKLNPALALLLCAHVSECKKRGEYDPLPVTLLDTLDLEDARESLDIGVYVLHWPSSHITIGKTATSFRRRLNHSKYYGTIGKLDEREGRTDSILFNCAKLATDTLAWASLIAYSLETIGICIFDTTDPQVGRNRNKADNKPVRLNNPDKMYADLWSRILELCDEGHPVQRLRPAEKQAGLKAQATLEQKPNTFAWYRRRYLQEDWPAFFGNASLYRIIVALQMLSEGGFYRSFPPLPARFRIKHKFWKPLVRGQRLVGALDEVARKMDSIEGKQVFSTVWNVDAASEDESSGGEDDEGGYDEESDEEEVGCEEDCEDSNAAVAEDDEQNMSQDSP